MVLYYKKIELKPVMAAYLFVFYFVVAVKFAHHFCAYKFNNIASHREHLRQLDLS